MKRVIVHSTKRVFDGFFKIDEAEVSYERFDGKMSPRLRRLCFERGDSVAAILYNRDSRKFIFVNQFKYPTYNKGPGWIMETVAGMVERGENPESALRREVLEETGYVVQRIEPVATFYVSPGGSSERVFLYYAEASQAGKTDRGGTVAAEGEDIETLELDLEDLERLLDAGAIQDGKTILGVQWLLRRLRDGRKKVSGTSAIRS